MLYRTIMKQDGVPRSRDCQMRGRWENGVIKFVVTHFTTNKFLNFEFIETLLKNQKKSDVPRETFLYKQLEYFFQFRKKRFRVI